MLTRHDPPSVVPVTCCRGLGAHGMRSRGTVDAYCLHRTENGMALSSLLKMLVQNDGDQVVIVLGERPALSRAGVPIRMFFPR